MLIAAIIIGVYLLGIWPMAKFFYWLQCKLNIDLDYRRKEEAAGCSLAWPAVLVLLACMGAVWVIFTLLRAIRNLVVQFV